MFTLDELCAVSPNFPMRETLNKLGMGASPQYVVTPEWVAAFNGIWATENINVIKLIAKMNVMKETRPFRDPTTSNAVLEDMGRSVMDTETFAYEACDQMNTFSITLAKTYIEETLGAGAKERMTKLSQDLIDTYKGLVANTPWLGEQSKQQVIEKLDHITLNVLEPVGGYYDMSGVELVPTEAGGTLLGNYLKLKQYHQDRVSMMIGQPAQPASLWYVLKPTLGNCFYDSSNNSINICPGYVTSLIYTDDMDDRDLLAGLGFTIGHEISHGFDYQGAQFDAYGTPNPVFADADVDAFVVKSSSLASYYSGLEVAPHMMVSGETVVTEATADLCGMQATLELANKYGGTDYRRFFRTFANIWASTLPEVYLPALLLDTHTLDHHRVNVNAQMFEELYETLGVKEGDRMYLAPQERINIWGQNA
jgi:putative endopeptidase